VPPGGALAPLVALVEEEESQSSMTPPECTLTPGGDHLLSEQQQRTGAGFSPLGAFHGYEGLQS